MSLSPLSIRTMPSALLRPSRPCLLYTSPDVYHLGNRVIVIGAGNAAMDVARTAIRHGTRHLECFSPVSYTHLGFCSFFAKKEPKKFQTNKTRKGSLP